MGVPAREIREGYYSDIYFVRSREVLLKDRRRGRTLMQVFCKKHALLAGMCESLEVLRRASFRPGRLTVRALADGALVRPWETVLTIEGDYKDYTHLETVVLGILTRRSSLASAVREVVDAARPRPVLYFAARFDHYANQEGDGEAVRIGGAAGVSTPALAKRFGKPAGGTIPHALIAAYGGDTVRALQAFDRAIPRSVPRIALVDIDNDCVGTALACARALGRRLWAVRLDTAETLWDRSIKRRTRANRGVSPELVRLVRRALDRAGFRWVKIVVSGGFTAEKVRAFRRSRVPFDVLGVGSSLLKARVDFTADIVKVDGRPCAKVGRRWRPNARLRTAW